MNTLSQVREELLTATGDAVRAAFPDLEVPEIILEVPREKEKGDFATTVAMTMAKAARMAPRAIAEKILEHLDLSQTPAESVEIAGPGFINFRLGNDWLYQTLAQVEKLGNEFGHTDVRAGQKIMVEFVSANPTGPMHMGNARGGVLGDSLASVLEWTGADVTREFYVNDAGAQIVKFGESLEGRYIQELQGEDAVAFSEDWYQGADIKEHAHAYIEEHGEELLSLPSKERQKKLVEYALPINLARLKEDLGAYKIDYDVWFMESTLHESGEVKDTVELLRKSGLTYEKEDALWFKSTEFGCEKDDVLVRANGIPTYFAADIAYHRNKFVTRGFDRVINVWGADHHGHIARMKGAMKALGIDPDRLDIVTMQLVRLMRDGKVERMSKRTGKMITFRELIEETGVDAARFFFNMRQSASHLDFDLDLAVEQSNNNPVFYVQYAHARICSIVRLLAEEGVVVKRGEEVNYALLTAPEEIALIRRLADFPDELLSAAEALEPSKITRYAMDVAANFHSFYNACRVREEDARLQDARLSLIDATRQVIRNAMNVLGVDVPEQM